MILPMLGLILILGGPVSGLAILSLNPSLQMKLTDDYAAGNADAHKSPVDECYCLITSTMWLRQFKYRLDEIPNKDHLRQ
jgi:hypothetical protein